MKRVSIRTEDDERACISSTRQEWATCEGGLTKRELATFMAMQGLCASGRCMDPKDIAKEAERIADATIAELARE